MKYREILKCVVEQLAKSNIIEAESDGYLLFESAYNMSRTEYILNGEKDAGTDTPQYRTLSDMVEKRKTGMPVQYITGVQEFMGLTFHVNENVLIPRFDTEILVEQVLKDIKKYTDETGEPPRILDMCTGSGCIAISLARHSAAKDITAADISEKAIETAKKNAEQLGTEYIKFIVSDLFDNIGNNKYDIIVSNPPYIRSGEIDKLMTEVKDFEPRLALDGTDSGLLYYEKITEKACDFLTDKGILAFETGCDQAKQVSEIMEEAGFKEISVKKDLAGLDRVVMGRYGI